MFTNPTVQDFINRELGGPTPISRPPPQAVGSRTALARALLGDITPPRMSPPLAAPQIRGGRGLEPSLPSEGVMRPSGSQNPTPLNAISGQGNTGASGLASGFGKLGAGIDTALSTYAANRAQQQAYADVLSGAAARPGTFGSSPRPTPFGTPPATAVPTFSPIGAANPTTPILASPGGGMGAMGTSIGQAGSLPTLAQGQPGTTAVAQFLNGIKAGEGTPYSGHSPTGAIGAYGLTGDFIKDWGARAGLPTDRASYENSPALQDKLATYAATQMYNKYGSWPTVAHAWLTGPGLSPTSAPGNMSPSAYVAKVMNAAGSPSAPSSGMAAYAATAPSMGAASTGFASDTASPASVQTAGSQNVIPGQSDPHQPGFDPSSVKFTNTPTGGPQANAGPAQVGGPTQSGIYNGEPYTFQTQPALGPQGMLQPPTGMTPLAAALAGQGDPNAPPALAPGIVAALDNPFLFGGGQFGAG